MRLLRAAASRSPFSCGQQRGQLPGGLGVLCGRIQKPVLNSFLGAPGGLGRVSVRLLISAQVTISRFVGSSPVLGSARTVWSLLGILSLSLSLCLLLFFLSL